MFEDRCDGGDRPWVSVYAKETQFNDQTHQQIISNTIPHDPFDIFSYIQTTQSKQSQEIR